MKKDPKVIDLGSIPVFAEMPKKFQLLFMLAMTDWSKFVWVCGQVLRTTALKQAVKEYINHEQSDIREAARLLYLQCGGEFEREELRACLKAYKPHVRVVAIEMLVNKEMLEHRFVPGDLLEIARSSNGTFPGHQRSNARHALMLAFPQEISRADLDCWMSEASSGPAARKFHVWAMAQVLRSRCQKMPDCQTWDYARTVLDAFRNN